MILAAPQDRSQGLQGEYFTSRKTRGDLRFHTHFKETKETYAAALELLTQADP